VAGNNRSDPDVAHVGVVRQRVLGDDVDVTAVEGLVVETILGRDKTFAENHVSRHKASGSVPP